jgi:lipopolysaccharide/colanic/teichoic acid biosynthesis glycosyltransferase
MASSTFKQVERYKISKPSLANCPSSSPAAPLTPSSYFFRKIFFDYLLAAILLLPGLMLMALLICLVRLTSRGPVIYSQSRVGWKGQVFNMHKIRSMSHNAEAHTGPAWTQTADPRVTWVGHFLRKLHLDELPQLFNVLRGEMSLVGPRPERPEFVEILARRIPDYTRRLAVRPGITGLSQLNLPPDGDLDDVRRKVVLDLEYIRAASWWLDLRLIVCTALRIAKLPILGLFGLQRIVSIPENDAKKSARRFVEPIVTLEQFQMRIEPHPAGGNGVKFPNGKHYNYHKCKKSQSKL